MEDVLCTFSSPPSTCGHAGLWHGEGHIPRTPWSCLDPPCPAGGPAATDIVCDLDFLHRSSRCLDDCVDGLCGPGIVKAICPRDATCWSVSVPSQGREGSPLTDFPIPFLCLSGKRRRGRCWPHTGCLSLARQDPSSPPGEVWSTAGTLGTAARTFLAAAQQRCVSPVCARRLPSVRMQVTERSVGAGSCSGWSHSSPQVFPFILGCSGHVASADGEEVSRKAPVCGWHLHGSRCWGGACSARRYLSLGHVELGKVVRS